MKVDDLEVFQLPHKLFFVVVKTTSSEEMIPAIHIIRDNDINAML